MKHEHPSKIIFLDIDGVINIAPEDEFNQECIEHLEYIITKTGASLVISSSWRDSDLNAMYLKLINHGFPRDLISKIIGITCRGYKCLIPGSKLPIVRGNEIKAWVDTKLKYPWHSNSELSEKYHLYKEDGSFLMMDHNELNLDYTYVILDDDTDMLLEQSSQFIHIDRTVGLTLANAIFAIDILNKIDN